MGAPMPASVCPHCQQSNPADSLDCSRCHKPLSSVSSGDAETQMIGDGWSVALPQAEAAGAAALVPGSVLGDRYEIVKLLGRGGMGAVYKARDREVDRLVALKIIRPDLVGHPTALHRFKQELILSRQITHRNVIRIFDLGSADGLKYITMEYIEGQDLSCHLEKRSFAPDEAVRIMRQVARALEAAHAEGVVHRDLKPQNIMMDASGKVSVMDFGLARSVEVTAFTQTGAMLGTPAYMSPEQAKGLPADARSDLFAFGIIFYELLTGKPPFQADTVFGMLLKRTQEAAPVLHENFGGIPEALSHVVKKCLATDPAARYQNAAEILADLDAIDAGRPELSSASIVVSGMGAAAAPALEPRALPVAAAPAPRPSRKKPLAIGLAVVLMAIAVAGFMLRDRIFSGHKGAGKPVSVLVADFTNNTGDPIFNGTLEPMFNVALEGASFVSAFSRGEARRLAKQLPSGTERLDEQSARLVAVGQGVNVMVAGTVERRGSGYAIVVKALDAVTGGTLANATVNAANKDEVLLVIPKLAAPVRRALGDSTSESAQITAAAGTFRAASLEAVHEYGVAMELQFAGKMKEALAAFTKVSQLDPNFARAYSGMAATSRNLGLRQDAEKYLKLATEHTDTMTERERYRTRGAYYVTIGDLQNCVEEFGELLRQYPADNAGHINLASCYSQLRNMQKAVEEAKTAVELSPKAALYRMNLALYASYAGDFALGAKEARAAQELNPKYEKAYLTLAYAQTGEGRFREAAESYARLASLSDLGKSMGAAGAADLAFYDGRYAEAVRTLESAAASEMQTGSRERAADRLAALACVRLAQGQKARAVEAAGRALDATRRFSVQFLMARVLIGAGETARAREIAAGLSAELQLERRASARVIEGGLALAAKDAAKAIQILSEANRMLDTWVGRFDLARAYLEAGQFQQADSEFDRCIKRRGEAIELGDWPSYGYFPIVYYYQGRVREGLKSAGFADSYRTYLAIRGAAAEDPLLQEVRRRAGK